jgi:hypothetical protein
MHIITSVRENVSESALRAAIGKKLPFKSEIMICPARDVIKLASKNPFARQPSGPDITWFVNVVSETTSGAASSPQSALGKRLAGEDHCNPRQIRFRPISSADESDQLSRQDREATRRASHHAQLEHVKKIVKILSSD